MVQLYSDNFSNTSGNTNEVSALHFLPWTQEFQPRYNLGHNSFAALATHVRPYSGRYGTVSS